MALKKCNECGKEISEHAKQCPNCGIDAPFKTAQKAKASEIGCGCLIILIIIFSIVFFFFGDSSETKDVNLLTLNEYRNSNSDNRKLYIEELMKSNQVNEGEYQLFYNCISQISYTKSSELKLSDTFSWCVNDYKRDPNSLKERINFDVFMSNRSAWNGAYKPLEKLIKSDLHDEGSYKHLDTQYRFVLEPSATAYAIAKTTYNANNLFGGTVKTTVAAKIDLRTGEIIQILSLE